MKVLRGIKDQYFFSSKGNNKKGALAHSRQPNFVNS